MRSTRAYLAGFGTAGSLLAAAAVLFIAASAVVSFRGFPEISGGAHTAKLSLPSAVAQPGAPTLSRRVLTAFDRPATHPIRETRVTLSSRAPMISSLNPSTSSPVPTPPPGSTPGTGTTPTSPGTVTSAPVTASPAPVSTTAGIGDGVTSVGSTLGGTVAGAGQNLSGAVTKTVAPVISGVSTISPNLGGAVATISHTVTTLVNNSTAADGQVISRTTGAVGGLLGAHH